MISTTALTKMLQTLVAEARDWQDPMPSTTVLEAEALIRDELAALQMENRDYLVPLTQHEIGAIAGFIAPTSYGIEVEHILLEDYDALRERFPTRAFWECVEEFGEHFYAYSEGG